MRVVPLHSSKDPLFQRLRSLRRGDGRQRRGAFLIEDSLGIEVALAFEQPVRALLATETWLQRAPAWVRDDLEVHVLSPGLMHKLFPTGKTPAVVAECLDVARPLAALSRSERVLVLEDIQDAGNLGSMLRTAEALGVADVVVLESAVTDLYNRVAVRASMGSMFRLRLYRGSLAELRQRLTDLEIELLVTSPHAATGLGAIARGGPLAVALGNEARGASEALLSHADHTVRIEMVAQVESLNVGAACAIALYALGPRVGAPGASGP